MTFIRKFSKPVNLTSLHQKGRALKSHVNLALNLKAGTDRKLTSADIEKYVGTLHRDRDEVRAAMTTFFNWSNGKGSGAARAVDANELKARIDKAVGIANRFNGVGKGELEGSAAREAMRRKTVRSLDALTELRAKDAARPLVTFNADFSQTQTGPVKAGSSFTLAYDPARLGNDPVSAFVSINGAKPVEYAATQVKAGKVVESNPTVLVPPQKQPGALDVQMWFKTTGEGPIRWDSDFERNRRLIPG